MSDINKFLKDKKLLILGGVFQHCSLVHEAHKHGVKVVVTDYLDVEKAPAKQIADIHWMCDIFDVNAIVEKCKQEGIDGVISTSLDACQKPYQQICEKLGLPCFGNKKQFDILTNKKKFKEYLLKNDLEIIRQYKEEDFIYTNEINNCIEFPILVKPTDSRGSRGQTVCNNFEEVIKGIAVAKKESATNEVIIEHYMHGYDDFSIAAIVINSIVYPIAITDRFLGDVEDGLEKLAIGEFMPSKHANLYFTNVHMHVQKFVNDIGLVNAPIFMQGFIDKDTIKFYDPGLRFPGDLSVAMFEKITGKNVFRPLIEFALTGKIQDENLNFKVEDALCMKKIGLQILPALRCGYISEIKGLSAIKTHPNIINVSTRFNIGDYVEKTFNVNQRFCEIDIICQTSKEAKKIVDYIYDNLEVIDEFGNNMIISKLNTDIFIRYKH